MFEYLLSHSAALQSKVKSDTMCSFLPLIMHVHVGGGEACVIPPRCDQLKSKVMVLGGQLISRHARLYVCLTFPGRQAFYLHGVHAFNMKPNRDPNQDSIKRKQQQLSSFSTKH